MDVSHACTDEFSNNLHDANALDNPSDVMSQEILQLNSASASTIMDVSSACTDEFSNNLHDANILEQSNSVKNCTSSDDLSNSCKAT